jgi:hypothetical protein
MKTIDKINLCVDLLLESASELRVAKKDIHFVKSILLSGAVNEIIEPLLKEHDIPLRRSVFVDLATRLSKPEDTQHKEKLKTRFFNFSKSIYNALKHAGGNGKTASQDLILEADLQEEAEQIFLLALSNFEALPPPYKTQEKVKSVYSDEFLELFQILRYELVLHEQRPA